MCVQLLLLKFNFLWNSISFSKQDNEMQKTVIKKKKQTHKDKA